MTLDRDDIAAIAAEVAKVLLPLLKAPALPPETKEPNDLRDDELVLMMAQPDPLQAIREREKRLREAALRKPQGKRRAA